MKACWCTLGATNPEACKNCSNYENTDFDTTNFYPNRWDDQTIPQVWPETRNVKRTTKTIEKYGPDGQYLGKEVITEEVEDYQKQVYDGTITIPCGTGEITTNGDISSCDVTWDPNNLGENWSYTNTINNSEKILFAVN